MARVAGGSCEIAVIADETTERMQLAHCGGEVSYDLPKVREHLEWTGFAAPVRPGRRKDAIGSLRVRDRETDGVSRRQIAGTLRIASLAPMPVGELAVDMGIEPARLRGHVAGEVYDLVAEGDSYVGTVLLGGQPSRFTIMGRAALWRMPAADQAALLPLVLGCAHAARRGSQMPILSVDFTSLGEE